MEFIITNASGQRAQSINSQSSSDEPGIEKIMDEIRMLPNPELATFRTLQQLIVYTDNDRESVYYADVSDDFVDDPENLEEVLWLSQDELQMIHCENGQVDRAKFDEAIRRYKIVVVGGLNGMVSIRPQWQYGESTPAFEVDKSSDRAARVFIPVEQRDELFAKVCEYLT